MAKSKFSLDFEGFLDLSRQLSEMGDEYLKKATENALTASKDLANQRIEEAMDSSPYSFNKGERYSLGKARDSLHETMAMSVEWEGTVCKAFIGPDLSKAPEAAILMYGSPHLKADTKLKNAMKVKGAIKKEVSELQQQEFIKVMIEANQNG